MTAASDQSEPSGLASDLIVFDEPRLEFRYGQMLTDPHDGLGLFGPYDARQASHPRNISFGLVFPTGVDSTFSQFSVRLRNPIVPDDSDTDLRLWPPFPGFDAVFDCVWPAHATRAEEIDREALLTDSRQKDAAKRAALVVDRHLEQIERILSRDDPIDVIVCAIPDEIYANCRPLSHVANGLGYAPSPQVRRNREMGQRDLFDDYDPEIYRYSVDFRRQLKARAMRYGVPLQLIRESTLRIDSPKQRAERQLTPIFDRAWNLSVALYYKAGGKPWRLSSAREGVCYIGLAYRRTDPSTSSRSACCAAQMFLDSGDGVVFMGKFGPWYSPKDQDFHLSSDAAEGLLRGVLATYQTLDGQPLREIFLHCRSGLNDDEFSGFARACPAGVKLVGVRVRQERADVRLYREGTHPVLRGTLWLVTATRGYLWASGFKPRLLTYDGHEVPLPLRIDVQYGEADLVMVARDIHGLTKLNYNTCKLGESQPVTVGFSDAVGEILVSNPTITERSQKFKFYI